MAIADDKKVFINVPEFTGENVPVNVAARVMKKDPNFVRQGILKGLLPFGIAIQSEDGKRCNYYISPMKFWQETGYIYRGET